MPNTIVTPSVIAKEALMQLKNSLHMSNRVNREYKKEFTGSEGDSVSIRRPVKFYTANGATRVNQDVEEKTTSVTIDKRKHVSWKFSTQDLTLSIEEYSARYIAPAMVTLANTMDRDGHALYTKVWNLAGTPGTTPDTFGRVSPAAQRLDEMAVPSDMRSLILNPAAHYAIAGDQTGLGAWDGKVKTAYQRAQIGWIAGMEAMSSQNVLNHTVGAHGGTPLVNGASQNVTYGGFGWCEYAEPCYRRLDELHRRSQGWRCLHDCGRQGRQPGSGRGNNRQAGADLLAAVHGHFRCDVGWHGQRDAHHLPGDHHLRPVPNR